MSSEGRNKTRPLMERQRTERLMYLMAQRAVEMVIDAIEDSEEE